VLFATATDRVTRLTDAHRAGRPPHELARLRRYGLIIVDEVGYLPFEQDAANLFFQLVSSRYDLTWLKLVSSRCGLDGVDDGSCVVVERGAGVQDVVAGLDRDAAVAA
jgi:DNA replication protein DnaC